MFFGCHFPIVIVFGGNIPDETKLSPTFMKNLSRFKFDESILAWMRVPGQTRTRVSTLVNSHQLWLSFGQGFKAAVTLSNVSCNLSRLVFATLWRDKLHETFHSVTYHATAKIVARQVARKVELNFTFGNGSFNLSRVDFGRCRVCCTVKTLRDKLHETFQSVTAP